jgi:hypothetical protein
MGSDVAAGQAFALQAIKPFVAVVDSDAPLPYQQMITMTPKTPVPITRLRTERGRSKSSSLGCCRSNDFPPLVIALSYCLEGGSRV